MNVRQRNKNPMASHSFPELTDMLRREHESKIKEIQTLRGILYDIRVKLGNKNMSDGEMLSRIGILVSFYKNHNTMVRING